MPRNIEIKARIDANFNDLIERIRPFADGPPSSFTQNDTFFNGSSGGRLKLRIQQVDHLKLLTKKSRDCLGFTSSINLL